MKKVMSEKPRWGSLLMPLAAKRLNMKNKEKVSIETPKIETFNLKIAVFWSKFLASNI